MRRTSDGKIRYAFSNAPEDMPIQEMIKTSTKRWSIEQCFEEGKDQLGMDHEIIEIVKYHTRRNFVAYRSHRKRQFAIAKSLKVSL